MKKGCIAVLLLIALMSCARGEELDQGLARVLEGIELDALERAAQEENLGETVLLLARGEVIWNAGEVLSHLKTFVLGEVQNSMQRMMGLLAPSLLCALIGVLRGKGKSVVSLAESICFLALAAVMGSDIKTYLAAAEGAVNRMDEIMESLFPILLTLLASVGSTAGTALFQPAVAAASGTMTTLVRNVSLPMALGMAVITMLDSLSEKMRLHRFSMLLRSCATWTLGIAFTVFIGVTALQGLSAGTADGVSIRAAKYAVDHFVPVVGGMFADTMDTLVGCSLLIKNALGITGMALLFAAAGLPMLRTLCAALMYRLCAALLQPVGQERVAGTLHGFSDVMTVLFVIQLSVGAMFMLLIAQMLAVGNAAVMLR
ncbi:MAG: stage III sporulation protein AE [Clostridia bacterium]|nr:stage III sporulation protein AE [Clostridia bacterium]